MVEKDGEAGLGRLLFIEATEAVLVPALPVRVHATIGESLSWGEARALNAGLPPGVRPRLERQLAVHHPASWEELDLNSGCPLSPWASRPALMPTHQRGMNWGPLSQAGRPRGLSRAGPGSFLSPAAPPFDVAPLSCICEDGPGVPPCRALSCSLHIWGQLFTISFPPEWSLFTTSFTSELVLNASLQLLRRLPHLCFLGGRPLLPLGAAARVTYCSGHLVSTRARPY